MVSVGASIKERREEKKISLNTVAKNLHISIDFLESIESDNFSAIPGSAYTIGYIRSYCNFLDLDADAIVMLYKDQINYSNKKFFLLSKGSQDHSEILVPVSKVLNVLYLTVFYQSLFLFLKIFLFSLTNFHLYVILKIFF